MRIEAIFSRIKTVIVLLAVIWTGLVFLNERGNALLGRKTFPIATVILTCIIPPGLLWCLVLLLQRIVKRIQTRRGARP
jgi:hypothetical protein